MDHFEAHHANVGVACIRSYAMVPYDILEGV